MTTSTNTTTVATANPSYAALWCKSNYSFLQAASHPPELVSHAYALGLRALALVDRDGVYGVVQAHVRAKELGMHLIIGSEISVRDGTRIVLLAMDLRGYQNLCGLISKGRLRCAKGESVVDWHEICAHAEGLIALWGGKHSALVLADGERSDRPHIAFLATQLKAAFGDRLYVSLARHREASEVAQERLLRERAERFQLPLVAAIETLYHDASRKPLHDVLTCIHHHVALPHAGQLLTANAEHALIPPSAFARLYADVPEAIERTREIAERCTFSLSEIRYRYPSERLPDGKTTHDHLRELTLQGAIELYPPDKFPGGVPKQVSVQVDKELSLIKELEYDGYFLTMHEIVRYCRQAKILCQGRGSAANSAVCYCLGITAVDPATTRLLFERFLSRERAEPPDIDLDIEHERREEVIQHMYMRYGRDHAAMVANVIRYRGKSAVRDVGKALGISEVNLDRIAKLLSHWDESSAEVLEHAGLDPTAPTSKLLRDLSTQIHGFPRHLSIHPGGFLLGHAPIDHLVPQESGSMKDRTVIQWDKDDVEALGLFKVDLLALGALSQMRRCFGLIEQHHGVAYKMTSVPKGDKPTYEMICKADTIGVFQIESRAQMSMLPRLKPKEFYDLVIEVSIVRPGPITGGMVHPYLRRRDGIEEVTYPHACLEPVLKRTLGVPLFQEQVMELAVVAADYTPGEADQLRRDMAAWRRTGRIEHHRERLVERMMNKGIEREFAERVFQQIRGFGEYGFPESHAASFALISYVTSWIKCHYPAIFACGLLNSQPMGFYSPATIIDAAKRHGVTVRPIDITQSQWDCTIERDDKDNDALRIGLRYVQSLREADAQRIEATAPFSSLEDFARRCPLDERPLRQLVEAGAFDGLGIGRRAALWKALQLTRTPELPLEVSRVQEQLSFTQLTRAEEVVWDYQASHHSARGHLMQQMRDHLKAQGVLDAKQVQATASGNRVRYAGLVICRQRPGTAKGVTFMTLEDETGLVNLVIWKKVFDAYAVIARTRSFLGVTGRIQAESGVVHLVVDQLWSPDQPAPLTMPSRDFH